MVKLFGALALASVVSRLRKGEARRTRDTEIRGLLKAALEKLQGGVP